MKREMNAKHNQAGFTIIEFLIATTVFVVVLSAGSGFFNNLNRSAIVTEETVDMQQDIRMAMVTLVRDISMAGYGISPAGFGACNNGITPTNSSTGPDSIAIASMGLRNDIDTLSIAALSGATQLTIGAPAGIPPTGQISINGHKTVQAVRVGTTNVVTITPALSGSVGSPNGEAYANGTQILTANCIQYTVNPATRTLNRDVDGTVSLLANGVLDMQFAYALDADGDNLIDDADGNGAFSAGDFVNAPGNLADIRLVRVSLFIQTAREDPNYILGTPMTLEDHDPTTDGGYNIANYQPFRSRVLTRIVRPRNIGLPE